MTRKEIDSLLAESQGWGLSAVDRQRVKALCIYTLRLRSACEQMHESVRRWGGDNNSVTRRLWEIING